MTKKIDNSDITLLIDTREQQFHSIEKYCIEKGMNIEHKKLDFGDYSFKYQGIDFSSKFSIERKNSLEEISSNLTANRERFKREFARAKGSNFHIVIENGSYDKVINSNYNTGLNNKAFLASLISLQIEFDVKIHFISKKYSPIMVFALVHYFIRNELKQSITSE